MADYLDTIMALEPLTFHRLQDTPASSGAIADIMSRQDMAYSASNTVVQDPFSIPWYSGVEPNIMEMPNSQASTNRIVGSTNAIWDRVSSTRNSTVAVWAKRVTTPSTSFPTIFSMGDTTNGWAVYLNATINRIDSVYTAASSTPSGGTGSGATYNTTTWALVAMRWNGSTGMQINVNGVDAGSRANPATKIADGVMTAQIRPGTRASSAHWEGMLADFMFFDYELSAAQLLSIYNAGQATRSVGSTSGFKIAVSGSWV